MAGEWSEYRFERLLIEPVRNGIYKKKEFHGRGAKIVNMGELFAYPRLRAVQMKRVELSESEACRFLIAKGDLLFARRSLVAEGAGKCSVVLEVDEPTTFESSIIRARPDSAKADSLYLYYFFNSPSGLYHLDTIRRQVAVSGITGGDLAKLEIAIPPIPEQRAIAHILGTLDDKIELNRRMSETLERQARALFKSWFVDFDPVRAKAEGRDPGLPNDLADLFPARLVDSELGEIPEGWRVTSVGEELAALISGSRPRGGAVSDGVPSIGAENILGLGRYDYSKEKFIPEEHFERLAAKGATVQPGDVLLYKDGAHIGRKTYFDCGFPHVRCAVNEHVFILRPRDPWMRRFLYFWLDLPSMTDEIVSLNSNSAQPGINQAGVRQLPMLRPRDEVIEVFDRAAGPFTKALFRNCLESRTLAALRDTLLPKLTSGELRVQDAERFIGRAG